MSRTAHPLMAGTVGCVVDVYEQHMFVVWCTPTDFECKDESTAALTRDGCAACEPHRRLVSGDSLGITCEQQYKPICLSETRKLLP